MYNDLLFRRTEYQMHREIRCKAEQIACNVLHSKMQLQSHLRINPESLKIAPESLQNCSRIAPEPLLESTWRASGSTFP